MSDLTDSFWYAISYLADQKKREGGKEDSEFKMPRRAGQDSKDRIQKQKREDMEDYFDSLQDVQIEVVSSRLLTSVERSQMRFPVFWNGARYTIVI